MRRILTVQAVLLLVGLSATGCKAFSYVRYSLPDLTAKADVIALGRVSMEKGGAVLAAKRLLKGSAGLRIAVTADSYGLEIPVKFPEGKDVILFMNSTGADGAALVGIGDQAIWPPRSEIEDTYAKASLDSVESAVKRIDLALSTKDLEQSARRVIEMIRSKDEFIQLAGLDTALSETYSASLPEQRAATCGYMGAFALDLLASKNADIRRAAINVVKHSLNVSAAPALIPMLTDPDRSCRNAAKIALGRVWADCKVPDPESLAHLDTPDEQNRAKSDCEAVWSAHAKVRLDGELRIIRSALQSSSGLEREGAAIFLNRLGLAQKSNARNGDSSERERAYDGYLHKQFGPLPTHDKLITGVDIQGILRQVLGTDVTLSVPPNVFRDGVDYIFGPSGGGSLGRILIRIGVYRDQRAANSVLAYEGQRTSVALNPYKGCGDRALVWGSNYRLLVNNVYLCIGTNAKSNKLTEDLVKDIVKEIETGDKYVLRGDAVKAPTIVSVGLPPTVRLAREEKGTIKLADIDPARAIFGWEDDGGSPTYSLGLTSSESPTIVFYPPHVAREAGTKSFTLYVATPNNVISSTKVSVEVLGPEWN